MLNLECVPRYRGGNGGELAASLQCTLGAAATAEDLLEDVLSPRETVQDIVHCELGALPRLQHGCHWAGRIIPPSQGTGDIGNTCHWEQERQG